MAILRSSAQVRSNSRQEAPGPFHVRSIAISKASKQILFFGPRSDDEQTKQHDAGHKEEPVCRRQGSPHSEQCGGVVKGMPDPAIGTLYDQGVLLSCDDRIGQVLPEAAEGPHQQPAGNCNHTDSFHLNQLGSETEDQAIQPGSTTQAISPNPRAAPTGRNVAKMNRPSC